MALPPLPEILALFPDNVSGLISAADQRSMITSLYNGINDNIVQNELFLKLTGGSLIGDLRVDGMLSVVAEKFISIVATNDQALLNIKASAAGNSYFQTLGYMFLQSAGLIITQFDADEYDGKALTLSHDGIVVATEDSAITILTDMTTAVITLPYGSAPTVSYDAVANVLTFGIPESGGVVSVNNKLPNESTGDVNIDQFIQEYGYATQAVPYASDLNAITTTGFYRYDLNTANIPLGSKAGGNVINTVNSQSNRSQMLCEYGTNKTFNRSTWQGVWNNWEKNATTTWGYGDTGMPAWVNTDCNDLAGNGYYRTDANTLSLPAEASDMGVVAHFGMGSGLGAYQVYTDLGEGAGSWIRTTPLITIVENAVHEPPTVTATYGQWFAYSAAAADGYIQTINQIGPTPSGNVDIWPIIQEYGYGSDNPPQASDFNLVTVSGFYMGIGGSCINMPTSDGTYGLIHTANYQGVASSQLAFRLTSDTLTAKVYWRSCNSSIFTEWLRLTDSSGGYQAVDSKYASTSVLQQTDTGWRWFDENTPDVPTDQIGAGTALVASAAATYKTIDMIGFNGERLWAGADGGGWTGWHKGTTTAGGYQSDTLQYLGTGKSIHALEGEWAAYQLDTPDVNNVTVTSDGVVFGNGFDNTHKVLHMIGYDGTFYWQAKAGSGWSNIRKATNTDGGYQGYTQKLGSDGLNLMTDTRWGWFDNNFDNVPNNKGGAVLNQKIDFQTTTQTAVTWDNELYTRVQYGNVWTEWKLQGGGAVENGVFNKFITTAEENVIINHVDKSSWYEMSEADGVFVRMLEGSVADEIVFTRIVNNTSESCTVATTTIDGTLDQFHIMPAGETWDLYGSYNTDAYFIKRSIGVNQLQQKLDTVKAAVETATDFASLKAALLGTL